MQGRDKIKLIVIAVAMKSWKKWLLETPRNLNFEAEIRHLGQGVPSFEWCMTYIL